MTPSITFFNYTLSVLTVLGQILIVIGVLGFIFGGKKGYFASAISFFSKHGLKFAFVVALVATLGSLTYSDIIGYDPCKLCWFQRIFMYPQVILLGVALWKKDRSVVDSSIALSLIGGFIALYHYYGQIMGGSVLPCSASVLAPSCSHRFFVGFGYITIPMMSLTAFMMILVFMFAMKRTVRLK